MEPLVWTEAPRTLGCTYHKQSKFTLGDDWFGVSVFVNQRIASDRPIAVTVQRRHDRVEVGREQIGLTNAHDEATAMMRISTALDRLGCHPELSAYRAGEVAEFLTREAAVITAALGAAGV